MAIKLRKAKIDDMGDVLRLIRELADFEKAPEEVEVSVKTLQADGFGKNPAFKVILAELDNEVAGMALFYPRYSTWKGKALHLEDLIVKEKFRRRGIGTALYTEVLRYAYDRGYKRVAWEVLDWNKPAIDFYHATGAKLLLDWRVVHMNEAGLRNYFSTQKNADESI